MKAYYNEHDPKAAAWLRELIKEGHIAPGEVDERSITDVRATDLVGFGQCHFFGGIGGWSVALRLAGVPDEVPVWTGSCPCQPFSSAGKQLGTDDVRHLWPVFFGLICECRPRLLFGEQVASAAVLGSASAKAQRNAVSPLEQVWLDGVCADLETARYACGAADIPAAGLGAPHIRQRIWWMAHAAGGHGGDCGIQRSGEHGLRAEMRRGARLKADGQRAEACGLADDEGERLQGPIEPGAPAGRRLTAGDGAARGLADVQFNGREQGSKDVCGRESEFAERGEAGGMGDAERTERRSDEQLHELQGGRIETAGGPCGAGEACGVGDAASGGCREQRDETLAGRGRYIERPGGAGPAAWRAFDILPCRDGKARRVESGTFPLAHGVSGRVGLLRGYGNAIVPQVAAEFIGAALEALSQDQGDRIKTNER